MTWQVKSKGRPSVQCWAEGRDKAALAVRTLSVDTVLSQDREKALLGFAQPSKLSTCARVFVYLYSDLCIFNSLQRLCLQWDGGHPARCVQSKLGPGEEVLTSFGLIQSLHQLSAGIRPCEFPAGFNFPDELSMLIKSSPMHSTFPFISSLQR